MNQFCTLVLAGGYGSRLGEIGKHTAKPLLKIGRQCLVDYALDKIGDIDDRAAIYVLVNSRFFADYQEWVAGHLHATRLILVNGQRKTESVSAGIITNIARTLESQQITTDVLIVGGDNLFDFSLRDFVAFGRTHGVSTIVVDAGSPVDAARFSVVVLGENERIVALQEKPQSPASTLVTTCIYWFPAAALRLFTEYARTGAVAHSFGEFMQWLAAREPIYGFPARGSWFDVGTVDVLRELQLRFAEPDDE
ncbi:MAG TPA: sugar phosphate nucleotidyltransferase [Thermoanaerobaculia bacterium]|nr:sugar phosphate nucleotidyltransferase [Thermoanaerobaculia bacterium]